MNNKSWRQAALSASLTIAVFSLLFLVLIWPALSARLAFYERIEALEFQYRKFTEITAQTPGLRGELEQLRTLETNREGFLEEKSKALAAAGLQKQVKSLVEGVDGELVSTQVMNYSDDSLFPAISVQVHMRSDIEALQQLLYSIDSDQLLLLIDNLLIQKRWQNSHRAQRSADQLEIRFDLSAFIYQSEAS